MSTFMQDSAAWLGERLKESAGHTGTYRQGGTDSDDIIATVAKHDYEVFDANGAMTVVTFYDWTFVATDLPFVPRQNDRWTPTINGTVESYEVHPPPGKRPVYERLDSSGILLLVHTTKGPG